jgi:hypothetical protein
MVGQNEVLVSTDWLAGTSARADPRPSKARRPARGQPRGAVRLNSPPWTNDTEA